MQRSDFISRIGGTLNRRYKDGAWSVVEVKNEAYANYYFDLTKHGDEYQ